MTEPTASIEVEGHRLKVSLCWDYELRGDSWHGGLCELGVLESEHPGIPVGTSLTSESEFWEEAEEAAHEEAMRHVY